MNRKKEGSLKDTKDRKTLVKPVKRIAYEKKKNDLSGPLSRSECTVTKDLLHEGSLNPQKRRLGIRRRAKNLRPKKTGEGLL